MWWNRRLAQIALGIALIAMAGRTTAEQDQDLPLIRWSFWAPGEQRPALERAFEDRIRPLLAMHGFVEGQADERIVPDDVLNQVYEVPSRQVFHEQRETLVADPEWMSLMRQLGQELGRTNDEGQLPSMAGLYRDRAGAGTKGPVPAPSVILDREEAARGHWTTFGVPEGLPGLDHQYLFEDRDGNIWVCTWGSGVARWDGERFTTFTPENGLAGLSPRHVMQGADGMVWISTHDGGLSRFDGSQMISFDDVEGAPAVAYHAMEDTRGHVWVLTDTGPVRWDGVRFQSFDLPLGPGGPYPIPEMLEDRAGRLWIPSNDGIRRWNGRGEPRFEPVGGPQGTVQLLQDERGDVWALGPKQIVRYAGGRSTGVSQRLPGKPASTDEWNDKYVDLALDRQGNVWVSNHLRGVFRWDGTSWSALGADVPKRSWGSIAPHPDGSVWFGGLDLVRWAGEFSPVLTTADGLDHREVRHLIVDRRGVLWIGTIGNLSRFDPLHFVGFLEDVAYWLGFDGQGRLWSGQGNGSALIEQESISLWPDGDPGNFAVSTADSTDWFGGYRIRHVVGETLTSYTVDDGLSPGYFLGIAVDPADGSLWFGMGPVTRFDGTHFHHYSEQDGLRPDDEVREIRVDPQGRLWFNQPRAGLTVLEGGRFTRVDISGRPADRTRDYFIDRDGVHWLGLDHFGIIRWDGETTTHYTTRDGLAHNGIRGITQSADGHLWFGTDAGVVSRFDGRVFQTLSSEDGLNGQSVRAVKQSPEGDMWFATYRGVIRYRQPPSSRPEVSVDAVIADQRTEKPSEISVPSTVDLIAVEFSARSLTTPPGNHVYLYRLVGLESQWHQTREPRVEYRTVAPGEYTFQVQAVDRDLVYSDTVSVPIAVVYQPTLESLDLDSLWIDDVFASFYKGYTSQPIGWARVGNNDPDSLRATISFQVIDWMRRASQQQIVLAPGESRRVVFTGALDPSIGQLSSTSPATARVELTFAVGADTISRRRTAPLTLHPTGALRWDGVAPLAAFITPEEQSVRHFARETLQRFDTESHSLGKPGHALLTAAILHETLRARGLKYQPDASQPYASRQQTTIDHVSYPARTLAEGSGDCDDLTALYATLLESSGIATALVDFPEHVFLLVDSGLTRWEGYRLPVPGRWTVEYGDRLWFPLEVTRVARPFREAWEAGAEEIAQLAGIQLRRRITTTAVAWESHRPVTIDDAARVEVPSGLGEPVSSQVDWIRQQITANVQSAYIDPLRDKPADDALRTKLMRIYISLNEYDAAIGRGLDDLLDGHGDVAITNNHLGIAYYLRGEAKQAAYYFRQAATLKPGDEGVQQNLRQALWALGRTEARETELVLSADDSPLRGESGAIDGDSFHWIE